jgi:hypothetical protein
MLDKRFCFLAGTGRTATHWFYNLFKRFCNDVEVMPFHDGLPNRLKPRQNARSMLSNYFLNLMCQNQRPQMYIECNPALVEWIGLKFGIKSARNVIPSDLLTYPAKSALVIRHPFGYIKSLKAKPWAWQWWKLPGFHDSQWARMGRLERMCYAWNIKNLFYSSLLTEGHCKLIKFESVFGKNDNDAICTVRNLTDWFQVHLTITDAQILQFRQRRFAPKGGHELSLTQAEKNTCLKICKPVMELFDYV